MKLLINNECLKSTFVLSGTHHSDPVLYVCLIEAPEECRYHYWNYSLVVCYGELAQNNC